VAAEERAVLFGARMAIPGLDQRLQALAVTSGKDQAPEMWLEAGVGDRGWPGEGQQFSGLLETCTALWVPAGLHDRSVHVALLLRFP
jgi:hypothetical protein